VNTDVEPFLGGGSDCSTSLPKGFILTFQSTRLRKKYGTKQNDDQGVSEQAEGTDTIVFAQLVDPVEKPYVDGAWP
jgi:hypothetical protein